MEQRLKKPDWEYSPEIIKAKNCEFWSNVDSLGKNVIYQDTDYKIVVDSFNNPSLIKLYKKRKYNEKKVGEIICSKKTYSNKDYIYLNYINIVDEYKGGAYSYRMVNSLLSILNKNIEGIVTNYEVRKNKKSMKLFFNNLGGYLNEFGYLEIKNPKII